LREYENHLKKITKIQNEKSPYHLIPINDAFDISNSEAHKFSRETKSRGFFLTISIFLI